MTTAAAIQNDDPVLNSTREVRRAGLQALVLFALSVVLFFPVLRAMYEYALWNPESTHAFAAPALFAILLHQRRHVIAAGLTKGSLWGLVLILIAVAIYFLAQWPYNYAILRRTAVAPAAAGIVLTVAGWKVLLRCLPLFLLLLIALPTGTRYYAFVIILPETLTLEMVQLTLDAIPGVVANLDGLDLSYRRGSVDGTIALGVSYRGASLFLSYLTIVVFMTFIRIRPIWQVLMMAGLSIPIILICNYLRLLIWGLVTIYGGLDPVSTTPRVAATIGSMVLAYLFSILFIGAAQKFFIADSAGTPNRDPGS